jgi:hypothetical protein
MRTKNALPVAIGLLFLMSIPLWADDPPGRVGRVSLVQGTVTFATGGSDQWQPATLNYPLTTGDQLQAAEGARAELQVGATAVRLAGNTRVTIDTIDDATLAIRLDSGSLSLRVRRVDAGESIQVATDTATVSLPVPGAYRVDQLGSGDISVTARSGGAEVTTGQGTVNVKSGQELFVPVANPANYTIAEAPAPDAWDTWVASRDRAGDQSVSRRYVSSDEEGVEELDDNGSWQVIAGYGPCWFPSVVVGWAPYRFGHWVWVGPWGWTWVDNAPWGYAPFHYGRWAFVGSRWAWVPGPVAVRPVWAPALVRWSGAAPIRTHPPDPAHATWVPLHPRQPYEPVYRATPAYVHALNTGTPIARAVPVQRPVVVVSPAVPYRRDPHARVTPIPPQERPRVVARPVVPPRNVPDARPVVVPPRPVPAEVPRPRPVYRPQHPVTPATAVPVPAPVARPARRAPPPSDQGDPYYWKKKADY